MRFRKILGTLLAFSLLGGGASQAFAEDMVIIEGADAVYDMPSDVIENVPEEYTEENVDQINQPDQFNQVDEEVPAIYDEITDDIYSEENSYEEEFVIEDKEDQFALPEDSGGEEYFAPDEEAVQEAGTDAFTEEQVEDINADEVLSIEEENIDIAAESAANVRASGTCVGTNVTWTLYTDGLLLIGGSGEMPDYARVVDINTGEVVEESIAPWQNYSSYVTSVQVTGISKIGYCAFGNMTNITKVTIGATVKTISDNAFVNDTGITEINLSEGLQELGDNAFCYAHPTSLYIPSSLTTIHPYSLSGLYFLERYVVGSSSNTFKGIDGVLFSCDGTTLISCPAAYGDSYAIPSGTTTIGGNAFIDSKLSNISIPSSVTTIRSAAFWYAQNLTSIEIPGGVKTIDSYAFYAAKNLSTLILNEGLVNIGNEAFGLTTKLTCVNIPSTVTDIANNAFGTWTKLIFPANAPFVQMEDGSYQNAVAVKVYAKEMYSYAYQVLDLVNQERTANGVSPLKMDTTLLESAMLRAYEISLYYEHTRPCGLECYSANSFMWAENIAAGQAGPAGVMNSWMNSSGHKANILESGYTTIGIGCVYYQGCYWWVQCFGSSLSSQATASAYTDAYKTRTVYVNPNSPYFNAEFTLSDGLYHVGDTAEAGVTWNGRTMVATDLVVTSSDPSVCSVNGRTITAQKAGKTQVSVYYRGNEATAQTFDVNITAATAQTITTTMNCFMYTLGKPAFNIGAKAKTALSYSSDNTSVATISSDGTVTMKDAGSAVITIKAASSETYKSAVKKIKVIVRPQATVITKVAPASNGITIIWNKVDAAEGYGIFRSTDGVNFQFASKTTNNTSLSFRDTGATANGTRYYYKVLTYKGSINGSYSGIKSYYRLKYPTITSATNSASGKIMVKYNKNTAASGYQVFWSTDNFATYKYKTIPGNITLNYTIPGLTVGKTYYIKVRSYKKTGSTYSYSSLSSSKIVKVNR